MKHVASPLVRPGAEAAFGMPSVRQMLDLPGHPSDQTPEFRPAHG
jgi:hypothetical protein